jgi:hypothetical protein
MTESVGGESIHALALYPYPESLNASCRRMWMPIPVKVTNHRLTKFVYVFLSGHKFWNLFGQGRIPLHSRFILGTQTARIKGSVIGIRLGCGYRVAESDRQRCKTRGERPEPKFEFVSLSIGFVAKLTNSHGGIEKWNRRFHIYNVKSHFEGLDAQRGLARCRHLLADLVHQVSDWCSGAAANFDWMREAKRENTRCGL